MAFTLTGLSGNQHSLSPARRVLSKTVTPMNLAFCLELCLFRGSIQMRVLMLLEILESPIFRDLFLHGFALLGSLNIWPRIQHQIWGWSKAVVLLVGFMSGLETIGPLRFPRANRKNPLRFGLARRLAESFAGFCCLLLALRQLTM